MVTLSAAALLGLAGCGTEPGSRDENLLEAVISADLEATDAPSEAASAPAPDKHLQALGTEPFWSVEVLGNQLRYSTPEKIEGTTFAASEAKDGAVTRYTGTLDGKPFVLVITPGTCSDGMSDTVYEWNAQLTISGQTERGCARMK